MFRKYLNNISKRTEELKRKIDYKLYVKRCEKNYIEPVPYDCFDVLPEEEFEPTIEDMIQEKYQEAVNLGIDESDLEKKGIIAKYRIFYTSTSYEDFEFEDTEEFFSQLQKHIDSHGILAYQMLYISEWVKNEYNEFVKFII